MTVTYTKSGNELVITHVLYHNPKMMEDIARYLLLNATECLVDMTLDSIGTNSFPQDEVTLKHVKTHINSDQIKQVAIDTIKDQIDIVLNELIEKINDSSVIANVNKISYKNNTEMNDLEVDLGINFPTK